MQQIRKENNSFIGHKRKGELIKQKVYENSKNDGKYKENSKQKMTLRKPELKDFIDNEKIINLEEKKDKKNNNIQINNNHIINSNITNTNIKQKKVCERCGRKNSILIFDSFKNILEYLTSKKIVNLFKNSVISEKYYNLQYDKLRMICKECLLQLSRNQTELENFIKEDNIINKENNEYPFDSLFDNLNLKNFNNNEKINKSKNHKNNIPSIKNNSKEILQKFCHSNQESIKERQIFNTNSNIIYTNNINNKGNIFTNPNLNIEYVNTLNSQFIPYENYNSPVNQSINAKIPNLIINNMKNNNFLKNSEIKESNNINQNIPVQYYLLNYPGQFQIPYLSQPIGFIPLNYNNNSNLNNLNPFTNIDSGVKNNNINQNLDLFNNKENERNFSNFSSINKDPNIINNNTNNNQKDLIIQNNKPNDYIEIDNKDFDEIFQTVSGLYHKLLNIKNNRDLNLDFRENHREKNFSSNYKDSSYINNKVFYNSIISDLNQINNFNEHGINNLESDSNFIIISEVNKINNNSKQK